MSYPGWNREDRIVALTEDGRTIAKGSDVQLLAVAGALITVTIPHLHNIEEVLEVVATYSPWNAAAREKVVTVSGNTVGVTIYDVTAGTTVTLDVIAIGI